MELNDPKQIKKLKKPVRIYLTAKELMDLMRGKDVWFDKMTNHLIISCMDTKD